MTQIQTTDQGWTGEKYQETKSLSTTDIAKLIRAEAKKKFPNVKTSITTQYFSGGSSIRIEIKSCPFNPINPMRAWEEKVNPYALSQESIYTEEGQELRDELKAIGNKYNYDKSDSMIDHFDVNFYFNVEYDWELTKQYRDEILAQPQPQFEVYAKDKTTLDSKRIGIFATEEEAETFIGIEGTQMEAENTEFFKIKIEFSQKSEVN